MEDNGDGTRRGGLTQMKMVGWMEDLLKYYILRSSGEIIDTLRVGWRLRRANFDFQEMAILKILS